ncbi:ABC transporter permease [Candidatus Sumerlaeota bacterium]|nr:ABC transporter permease [Candidatus Sumerlaeota bacterium]
MITMIKRTIRNRGLVKDFIYRDFKARFAGSILGFAWNILHPLVMILIYVMIFSQVMKAKLPGSSSGYGYSIYLCSGLLPWSMFNELLMRYTQTFLEHSNLIKKVSFPREILHVSALLSGCINFAIGFTIFVFFLAILHVTGRHQVEISLGQTILLLLGLGFQQVFCLGLGLAFSVLNVFFRDVGQLVMIIAQLWFWVTPIVYPLSVIPEKLKLIFVLNPMYHFMSIYRSVLYVNQAPEWKTLGIVSAISIITFVIGYGIYNKLVTDVSDEI